MAEHSGYFSNQSEEATCMNRTGKDLLIDLSPYCNGKAVTWKHLDIEGRLDYHGLHIHGDIIPNGGAVTAGETDFAFPLTDSEADDHISCEGLLELNADRPCREAAFLGFCTWGNFKGPVKIRYTDGTEERRELALSDWIQAVHGTKGFFKDELVFTFPYCHQGEMKHDQVHGFFVDRIELDPCRLVRSVELPDNPNMFIFALTLVGTDG
jgi:hypothetical protein